VYVAGEAAGGEVAVSRFDALGTVDDRFSTDGSLSFNVSGGDDDLVRLEAMSDGGVLLLVRSYVAGVNEFRLVRLKEDGSFDGGYGTAGTYRIPGPASGTVDWIFDMAQDPDGSTVLSAFTNGGGGRGLMKVTAAGAPATFGNAGWFDIPAGWASDGAFVGVDSSHRVLLLATDIATIRRISPAGVLEPSFSVPAGDDFYVSASDGVVTWRNQYDFGSSVCLTLAISSFNDQAAPTGTDSINLGCDSGLEQVLEVSSKAGAGFVLSTRPDDRLVVRKIAKNGTQSDWFGVDGVALLASGFNTVGHDGTLAVDASGRPLLAFKEYPTPPLLPALRVTRFRNNGGQPLDVPADQLTGGVYRNGSAMLYDPVDTATGNLADSWADLDGEAFGLTVTRSYNGLSSLSSPLGARWLAATGPSVFADGAAVSMVTPQGARYRFVTDGSGGYLPAEGVAGVLSVDVSAVPSGGGTLAMLKLVYNDGSIDRFDTAGRLLTQQTWDGQTATSTYGPNGVTAVTASTGQSVSFAYNASGRLSSVATSSGRTVSYGYNAQGLLSTVTDEHGGVWSMTYTPEGRLKTMTDPTGVVLETNTYDTQGRVVEQLLPPNTSVTFGYDDGAGETLVTERQYLNNVWVTQSRVKFVHDADGKVVVIYDENSDASVVKLYDELGNLVENKTRSDLTETATYDTGYNLTSITDPATGTSTYTYDTSNRVLSSTTPDGATTTYTYDGTERSPSTVTDELGHTTSYDIVNGLVMSQTDADGVTTTYTYDTKRRLTSTADEYGNTTTRYYDNQNRLIRTVSPGGRQSLWTYNTADRLQSTTAPDGGVTTYTYDPAGRVLTVTDPAGAVSTNTYDPAGNLATVTDPAGAVTTYGYDYAGRQVSTRQPGTTAASTVARDHLGRVAADLSVLGNTDQTAYTPDGQIASRSSSPIGGQTVNGYDDAGRRVSTTDPAGRISTSTFDTFGRVASQIAPGGATTGYTYDALGRQSVVTDPRGGATSTTYTPGGRVATVTDAAGLVTLYGYDNAGRQTTVTAPGNRTTSTVFDGDGLVTTSTSPGGLVTGYTYDAGGRAVTITDAAGVVTTRTYTLRGELKTEKVGAQGTVTYAYNPAGTLASVTDPNGKTTTFTYDGRGNMLTRTNAAGGVDRWTYNDADQVLTAKDPLGRVTTMSYNQGGQLTSMTDPSGRTTSLTYNPDGTPNTQTTGVGNTTYTYDAAGRVASMTDTTGTLAYAYNVAGDLVSMTTPTGAVTTWSYDQAGRRTSVRSPDGRGVRYAYNNAGQLASITQTELLLDSFGQPDGAIPSTVNWTRTLSTGATNTVQAGAAVLTVPNTSSAAVTMTSKVAARMDSDITFKYQFTTIDPNNKGRLIVYARYTSSGAYRIEIDAGATTGTVYKKVGSVNTTLGTFPVTAGTTTRNLRLKVVGSTIAVTAWDPAAGPEPTTPTASFTSAGVTTAGTSRVSYTRVTGTTTLTIDDWRQADPTTPTVIAGYTYNPDGQITNEALIGGTRTSTYTNGRRTGFNETVPGATRSTAVTYDTTGRLVTETTSGVTTTYGYDPASQLTSVTPSTGSATVYTYDALGRRSSDKVGTAASTKYVYDPTGQLCWTTTKTLPTSPTCASPLSGSATFAWDNAGRLVNETRTATNKVDYSYDPAGRLNTITRLNGTSTTTQTRTYNADGLLAQSANTTGTVTTTSKYSWDPTIGQVPQLAAITDTTGTVSNLTYGPTGWAGVHTSTALSPVAVATDIYGSVITSTGNALARNNTYTAFGTPSGTNTFDPKLGYRGELTLDNQLWLRARTYQPTIGRFTTRDPATGRSGTATLTDPYHYTNNNPTNLADPTGGFTQAVIQGTSIGESRANGSTSPNSVQADNIRFAAGCYSDSEITYEGACLAADLLESGKTLSSVRPYLVGFDVASLVFASEGERRLFATINGAAAAVFQAGNALPDYFVADLEFIGELGIGAGLLGILTRNGTVFGGVQGNIGRPGGSLSLRAGYLAQPFGSIATNGAAVDDAVDGWAITGAVVANVPTVVYGGALAVTVGLKGGNFPRGFSGSLSYEIGSGFVAPLPVTASASISLITKLARYPWLTW
jgi:RHS repeat-associated protein